MSQNKVCTCKGLHTLECVIDQYKNSECTLGWAADKAGISTKELGDELIKRGIQPYGLDKEVYKESMKLINRIT